jgi:hypothetical protein
VQVTDPEFQQLTPYQQFLYRVDDAMGSHDLSEEDRDLIRDGYNAVPPGGSVDDMPPESKAALERVEKLPRTAWDDPSDVPDDTPDDF